MKRERIPRLVASRAWWSLVLFFALELAAAVPTAAKWAHLSESVPMDRLLRNISRYVAQHPNDARGHYVLGRLHSLAFAQGAQSADVLTKEPATGRKLALPEFPGYQTIQVSPTAGLAEREAEALRHLTQSIRSYRRSTQLAPKEALYWLGLGWMLEQGVAFASQAKATFLARPKPVAADRWREEVVQAYHRAYDWTVGADLKRQGLGPGADTAISMEAGEGLLRLLPQRPVSPKRDADIARIQASVKALQGKPRAITPILFPLDGAVPLTALLALDRSVTFDLDGDGRPERWPWVGPNTGILVWDPEHTGRIISGRQLFGSVTWWMFWQNGYQPLSALDDNSDGWLSGAELDGLAAWRDRNGNGISEPGEVVPLPELGITRVAVRPFRCREKVWYHPHGLERSDGTFLPTYDWAPLSLPR